MIVHGHNSCMFQCGLVGNANERRPFPDVNKVTDFAVVHDSPSIGAGPSIALFQNSKMVSHQTMFCPGGPPLSESLGSCTLLSLLILARKTLPPHYWSPESN